MALIRHHDLVFSLKAGGNIYPRRVVIYGADDDTVVQATAGTDMVIGVSYIPDSEMDPIPVGQARNPVVAAGDMLDVVFGGIAEVDFGGTITRGQRLTANADGKAVAATPGDYVVGIATVSGADGDLGSMLVALSQVDTPPT